MKNIQISNIKFIIIYTSMVFIINNALIYEKLIKWFITKDVLDLTGFIAYLIVGLFLCIAFISLLSHKYTTKIFAILIVSTSAFV